MELGRTFSRSISTGYNKVANCCSYESFKLEEYWQSSGRRMSQRSGVVGVYQDLTRCPLQTPFEVI